MAEFHKGNRAEGLRLQEKSNIISKRICRQRRKKPVDIAAMAEFQRKQSRRFKITRRIRIRIFSRKNMQTKTTAHVKKPVDIMEIY